MPGSENQLQIGGDGSTVSYAFDRNINYFEESITFWEKENTKGLIYCSTDKINCVDENYNDIFMTVYYDGLVSDASNKCDDCYYLEGNLKYNCSQENDTSSTTITVTLDIIDVSLMDTNKKKIKYLMR